MKNEYIQKCAELCNVIRQSEDENNSRMQGFQMFKVCMHQPEVACTRRCVSSAGTRSQQGHGVISDFINAIFNCPFQTCNQRMVQAANARARPCLHFADGRNASLRASDLLLPSLDVLIETFLCERGLRTGTGGADEVSCSRASCSSVRLAWQRSTSIDSRA